MTVTPPAPALRRSDGATAGSQGTSVEGRDARLLAGRAWLHHPAASVGGLVGLSVLSVLLRVEGIGIWYWIDEALTVGLASQPFTEIPSLLQLDGSPPLYYLLLRIWIGAFGTSEVATHSLSLVFAVAAVPVGWWAGRSLFGSRAGWITAIVAATSPFLTYFARETRMYSLVTLLALVVAVTFVHAFVNDDRSYTTGFVASSVALLYTHNWGLHLMAACVVALVPAALAADDRRALLRRATRAFGVIALAYLPWAVVLVGQIGETGAPWSYTPTLREALRDVAALVRDERVLVLLVVAVSGGIGGLLAWPRTRLGASAWALITLSVVPIVLGWGVAHFEPSWATRYLAVVVGPMLLLAGWGMARAGTVGVVALVLGVALWLQPFTRVSGNFEIDAHGKSDARAVAARLDQILEPGDVVLVAQPEAVPLFAHYLGDDLRYATLWGEVAEPDIMDWRDSTARLEATTVEADLRPIVDDLAPGQQLALVGPGAELSDTDTDWIRTFHSRHLTWRRALGADEQLDLVRLVRVNHDVDPAVPFVAQVFVATGDAPR